MTFEEYVAMLEKFMANHPECRTMQVSDSQDEMPSQPEIVEGQVILADSF